MIRSESESESEFNMFSSQSMNTESESSDNASTSTSTSKSAKKAKSYAFAASNSSASMFTYTQNSKTVLKNNSKKWKMLNTSQKLTNQTETILSDTEEKDLTAVYNTAKKALNNVLSKVKTSAKIEIKQALYYLKKALKQNSAENSVQTQLSQLNAKINLLLCKQDTTITITQKVVEKAVKTVKK